jgi:hypothetical protein
LSTVKKIFYKKNSQYLQISGLKDQSVTPATYVNTAVLTATLYDASNVAVAGATNMSGTYQASSNGVYRFAVDPNTFDPPIGSSYTLIVDGTAGAKRYHDELPVKVVVRDQGTEI